MHATETLPPLTPEEATALGYFLVSPESLNDAALACGCALGEFFMILSSPACQAHIKNALKLANQRADYRVAEARYKAAANLEEIADNPEPPADHTHLTERRRAATTIIRAQHRPRTTARRHESTPHRNASADTTRRHESPARRTDHDSPSHPTLEPDPPEDSQTQHDDSPPQRIDSQPNNPHFTNLTIESQATELNQALTRHDAIARPPPT